jgi:hypothetical protein
MGDDVLPVRQRKPRLPRIPMTHKRKGQLTVSGEWARHLRPLLRRAFWKGKRQAGKDLVREEREHVELVSEPQPPPPSCRPAQAGRHAPFFPTTQ